MELRPPPSHHDLAAGVRADAVDSPVSCDQVRQFQFVTAVRRAGPRLVCLSVAVSYEWTRVDENSSMRMFARDMMRP